MSNKGKVIAVYPDAYCCYSKSEQKFIVWGNATVLGVGETPMWSWAIANDFLTKQDKSELYE